MEKSLEELVAEVARMRVALRYMPKGQKRPMARKIANRIVFNSASFASDDIPDDSEEEAKFMEWLSEQRVIAREWNYDDTLFRILVLSEDSVLTDRTVDRVLVRSLDEMRVEDALALEAPTRRAIETQYALWLVQRYRDPVKVERLVRGHMFEEILKQKVL